MRMIFVSQKMRKFARLPKSIFSLESCIYGLCSSGMLQYYLQDRHKRWMNCGGRRRERWCHTGRDVCGRRRDCGWKTWVRKFKGTVLKNEIFRTAKKNEIFRKSRFLKTKIYEIFQKFRFPKTKFSGQRSPIAPAASAGSETKLWRATAAHAPTGNPSLYQETDGGVAASGGTGTTQESERKRFSFSADEASHFAWTPGLKCQDFQVTEKSICEWDAMKSGTNWRRHGPAFVET